MEAEQLSFFDPTLIEGEQGAIGMETWRVDLMTFKVTCYSHTPPHVMLDETGAHQAMAEVAAPTEDGTPGTYEATVVAESEGAHHLICFNATCRVREKVFTGDIPIWDPGKVESNTYAGRKKDQVAQYAQMLGVTGKVG
jgi:hypothetical protein